MDVSNDEHLLAVFVLVAVEGCKAALVLFWRTITVMGEVALAVILSTAEKEYNPGLFGNLGS